MVWTGALQHTYKLCVSFSHCELWSLTVRKNIHICIADISEQMSEDVKLTTWPSVVFYRFIKSLFDFSFLPVPIVWVFQGWVMSSCWYVAQARAKILILWLLRFHFPCLPCWVLRKSAILGNLVHNEDREPGNEVCSKSRHFYGSATCHALRLVGGVTVIKWLYDQHLAGGPLHCSGSLSCSPCSPINSSSQLK